jgi:hypothetical protein
MFFSFFHGKLVTMDWLPDAIVPLLLLLAVLGMGWYYAQARSTTTTTREGWTAGLALAAVIMAQLLVFLPGETYELGVRSVVPTLCVWLLVPLLAWNILPGLAGASLGSPWKYLSLRFHPQIGYWAGLVALVGRGMIAALALAVMSRMLSRSTDGFIPGALWVLLIGLSATLYAYFAGRAGVWQLHTLCVALLLSGAAAALIVILKPVQGFDHLWKVAQTLDRTALIDPQASLDQVGSLWIVLPGTMIAALAFFLADESVYQPLRELTEPLHVRLAFFTCLAVVSVWIFLQTALGLSLAVFYVEHPLAVRPQWVANVDRVTRLSLTDPATQTRNLTDPRTGEVKLGILTGLPERDPTYGTILLDWNNAEHQITLANLPRLLAEQRLLNPNHRRVFAAPAEVQTDDATIIDPAKLATFRLGKGTARNEMVLHRRAAEELWPHFVARQSAPGLRGLFIAGILVAAWSFTASNVQVLGSNAQMLFPLHRAQPFLLLAGGALVMLALPVEIWLYFPGEWLIAVFAITITPIAAVVALGLTSRYATSNIAGIALVTGSLWTAIFAYGILTVGKRPDAGVWNLHVGSTLLFAFGITYGLGQLACLVAGRKLRRGECAGLVIGAEPLGMIRPEEADLEIEVPEEADQTSDPRDDRERWR